jgi:hypothetical protein
MFRIALTLFAIVGTTLSGVILIAMLATPNFIDHQPFMAIWAAVAGFTLAIPSSMIIAKLITRSPHRFGD